MVSRFLEDELVPARSQRHPNLIELIDAGKAPDGAYFAVMEFVDGCTLRSLLARRERLAIQLVVQVIIECCKGLAAALAPRGMSPRHVLLSSHGEVKLGGLGHADHAAFGYLSPEAASGRPLDHRSDVFSAGVVLWKLLAGRRLFVGDTDYQTIALIREARVVPIAELDPALEAIVRKALARDVAARYQRTTDLADALAGYARSRSIELLPATVAAAVRDARLAITREPIDPDLVAHMQAEVSRTVSIR